MCQLEKPRTNEMTETLTFTVCKLELRGKGIVSQSRSKRTRFSRDQLWAKRKKTMCFAKTKTNQGASAAARVQGGTRYGNESCFAAPLRIRFT